MRRNTLPYILLVLGLIIFCTAPYAYAQEPYNPTIDSLLTLSERTYAHFEYFKSLDYAKMAMELAERDEGISKYRAQSYFHFATALGALEFYEFSMTYAQKTQREKYIYANDILNAEVHNLLAFNYIHLGSGKQFLRETDTVLALIKNTRNSAKRSELLAKTYDDLGSYYIMKDKPDAALVYLGLEKQILDSLGNSRNRSQMADFLIAEGYAKLKYKDPDSALASFEESLAIKREIKDPVQFVQYNALGKYYQQVGNFSKALHYYWKTQQDLNNNDIHVDLSVSIYNSLAQTYKNMGDEPKSTFYEAKYERLEDSLIVSKCQKYDDILEYLQVERSESGGVSIRVFSFIISALLLLFFLISLYAHKKWEQLKIAKITKEREAKSLKGKVNEAFEEVVRLAKNNDSLFWKRFAEVYTDFTKTLEEQYPDLSPKEKVFCAMLYLNFSTKEIAAYTYIEHRSVQKKRSRLRKKMGLNADVDINAYLRSLPPQKGS